MKPLIEMDNRREAATPGPWKVANKLRGYYGVVRDEVDFCVGSQNKPSHWSQFIAQAAHGNYFESESDAQKNMEFIAHSITDHERMSKALKYALKELKEEARCYCNLPTYKCGYCLREEKIQSILEGKNED